MKEMLWLLAIILFVAVTASWLGFLSGSEDGWNKCHDYMSGETVTVP